jgi:UDP-N-acetylmuramyl pentapeptide phosphotransferase/UDP-N-acetylglucosamine-1-phosphate transferase
MTQETIALASLIFVMKIIIVLLGILTIIDCVFLILRINRFKTRQKIRKLGV